MPTAPHRLLRLLLLLLFTPALLVSPAAPTAAAPSDNARSPLGINLAGVSYYSTEQPFVDFFKVAGLWLTKCVKNSDPGCTGQWDTGEQAALDLDARGWVRSLPAPSDAPVFTRVSAIIDEIPAGDYLVLYEGSGTLSYPLGAQRNAAASRPGRDVITVSGVGLLEILISSTDPQGSGDYLRNIRVVAPAYERTHASQIFNPTFLERLSPFRALRFMDWMRTNTSNQVRWSDRPHPDDASYATEKGVPAEIMLALANRLQADAWITVPHRADDGYIAGFAALARAQLAPNLQIYVEYSNEVWNAQFGQYHWVADQAKREWAARPGSDTSKLFSWIGRRVAQICDSWEATWGDAADRVVCVMGAQAASYGTATQALDCVVWTEGAPCAAHGIDALAIAPYFGGYVGHPKHEATLTAWAGEPDGGLSKLFEELETGALLGEAEGGAVNHAMRRLKQYAPIAERYELRLVGYEAGQHLTGVNEVKDNDAITRLLVNANRDPRMGALYDAYLAGWKANGGGLMMHFSSAGAYSKWGSWGALERIDDTSSPKYDALVGYIAATPCWWENCARAAAPTLGERVSLPLLKR